MNNISGNLEASAFSGSLDVKMASVNDFVKISNNGNISLSLPASKGYNLHVEANNVETNGLKNFHGTKESNKIEGTVGNGGAEITATSSMETESVDENGNTTNKKSSSGSIRLSFE